jgi:hypothetical protein
MNCTTVQSRLLGAEQPARPAAAVREHLEQCPACRAWHRRLVQLEGQIPQLPVPPSEARGRLVRQFLEAGAADAAGPPPAREPAAPAWARLRLALARPGAKERALRKLALAFALAAALAAFALGWWAWPHQQPPVTPPGPDYLRALQGERDQRLARAHTARERVQALAALVDDLQARVREHVADADKLDVLAGFYAEVVQGDLVRHARDVPGAERVSLLHEVADRLKRAESEASRLEAEWTQTASARPLHDIATAARQGERSLRALAAEVA